ncbi:hypothetical protein A1Q2_04488 [Trichosporon asahii var. asahii CBS 8904]|uniref:Uncharacterized protein n=1 Tax=Trichosporon asahii var. asahii (strain CBS 8904) TaxID=1220162 RepID=K1VAX1_TRIAC|nr:hypothetical protein A1Q2_04488 [Trichosporon asahii var. asahii CBS 8904]
MDYYDQEGRRVFEFLAFEHGNFRGFLSITTLPNVLTRRIPALVYFDFVDDFPDITFIRPGSKLLDHITPSKTPRPNPLNGGKLRLYSDTEVPCTLPWRHKPLPKWKTYCTVSLAAICTVELVLSVCMLLRPGLGASNQGYRMEHRSEVARPWFYAEPTPGRVTASASVPSLRSPRHAVAKHQQPHRGMSSMRYRAPLRVVQSIRVFPRQHGREAPRSVSTASFNSKVQLTTQT